MLPFENQGMHLVMKQDDKAQNVEPLKNRHWNPDTGMVESIEKVRTPEEEHRVVPRHRKVSPRMISWSLCKVTFGPDARSRRFRSPML